MGRSLSEIANNIIQFRDDRDWGQYHDPKNLAQALSIEVAELQEIFLWQTLAESRKLSSEKIKRVKEEVADIFIYLTYLCHTYNIDLLEAVEAKLQKNSLKYPIAKAKGSRKKYTEL
jgi:NTP pyrophosphatase (non-canonical NTP hydrolase)